MIPRGSRNDQSGFTLTELMVVLLILALLITIAVASFSYTTRTAARVTCEGNRHVFDTAATIYRAEKETAPGNLGDLAPYVANFDTAKVCPGDGSTLLRYDPSLDRVICDFHE